MGKMIITIKNGKITSEIKGVKGKGCQEIDKFLNEIGRKESDKNTLEYYQGGNVDSNSVHIINR
jgi:hypothetical protein